MQNPPQTTQQVPTRIDPQVDAVVIAGSVDVGALSTRFPTSDAATTFPGGSLAGADRIGMEDVEERFKWQALDNQNRLKSQVGSALRSYCRSSNVLVGW